MPPTNFDYIKNKSHDDNCDNNNNGDKVGGENQGSDNLKDPNSFII